MASLRHLFGLSSAGDQDMVADSVRKASGDFVVWVMDTDTGVHLRDLRFASAQAFADEIKTAVMKDQGEAFDLSGKDLRGIDFSETTELYAAKFDGSDLTGARLNNADLTGARFKGAILKNTDFTQSIIRYADFSKANMEGANMDRAKVNRTVFKECNMRDANLQGMNAPDADFMLADLRGANTQDMNVHQANLYFAKLTRQQFAACKNNESSMYRTASHLLRRSARKSGKKPS